MKRYEIYPHLLDDIIAIEDKEGEYVKHDQAHSLLKEAYESIVKQHNQYEYNSCSACGEWANGEKKGVTPNIVLKATEYLEGEG